MLEFKLGCYSVEQHRRDRNGEGEGHDHRRRSELSDGQTAFWKRTERQVHGVHSVCSAHDGMLFSVDGFIFGWYFTGPNDFNGILRKSSSFNAMRPIFPPKNKQVMCTSRLRSSVSLPTLLNAPPVFLLLLPRPPGRSPPGFTKPVGTSPV